MRVLFFDGNHPRPRVVTVERTERAESACIIKLGTGIDDDHKHIATGTGIHFEQSVVLNRVTVTVADNTENVVQRYGPVNAVHIFLPA
jgi:hypothetical protein